MFVHFSNNRLWFLNCATGYNTKNSRRKIFLFIKFYARWRKRKYTGGKNQYSVFSEHCFSHFMLSALLFAHSHTHKIIILTLTHTNVCCIAIQKRQYRLSVFLLPPVYFFGKYPRRIKLFLTIFLVLNVDGRWVLRLKAIDVQWRMDEYGNMLLATHCYPSHSHFTTHELISNPASSSSSSIYKRAVNGLAK